MRRTKHRRRFHTGRVITNRRRRARDIEGSSWRVWWAEHPPANGRLRNTFYVRGCGRARCYLCHGDKLLGRRAEDNRAWREAVAVELSELGL